MASCKFYDDAMNATQCNWSSTMISATADNSSDNDVAADVRYHSLDYRLVGSLLVGLIFVVGLTGNALVVAVVVRVPEMRSPTNWYLVSLALADIVLLVSAPLPTLVEYHVVVDQWVFGAGACSVAVFAQYLGVNMSSLSMTAFTVERYVAICHPFTARVADLAGRARRVIVTLWIAGVAYCTPWLLLATTIPRRLVDGRTISICTFSLPRDKYLVYYLADLVLFYATPLLTASVLYALIARTLLRRTRPVTHRRSRRPTGDDDGAAISTKHDDDTAHIAHGASATGDISSNVQVVKMLVVVVASFATLWLPYRAYVVYNSFAARRYKNRWFLLCCRLAVYANSAVNPLLYNAMSTKFRMAFTSLLCRRDARMPGRRVLFAGTAAASLVAMQPGASDLSRQAIQLHSVTRAVKNSSLVTVDCR